MRQVLLFDARKAFLNGSLISCSLCLFAQMLDSADQETTGAARWVENRLAEAWIDLLDYKLRNGPRGVKLARIPGGLQVLKQLFIDVAKHMPIVGRIEVDAVDLVDDL